jgi:hypothetical protein
LFSDEKRQWRKDGGGRMEAGRMKVEGRRMKVEGRRMKRRSEFREESSSSS